MTRFDFKRTTHEFFDIDSDYFGVRLIGGAEVIRFPKNVIPVVNTQTSGVLYMQSGEVELYVANYASGAQRSTDVNSINTWTSSGGGASESTAQEIAENTVRGIAHTETNVPLTTTVSEILPANANRKSLKIFNRNGSNQVRFGLDSTLAIYHILPAGGTNGTWYEYPQPVPTDAIYARANTGTSTIIVTEG
jgi:hypothetical protein